MHFALIGDIVKSKKIENRYQFQEKLDSCFKVINEQYQNYLAANFLITIGDEFQALFIDPSKIFEIISKIEVEMEPVKIRFAIGCGEIITGIQNTLSIGTDGPAWWMARDAINELKRNHEKGLRGVQNIKIKGLKDRMDNDLINNSLSLCFNLKEGWTQPQKQIIHYLIKQYGLTDDFIQAKVANELQLTAADLNKKLKSAQYFDYLSTYSIITKILQRQLSKGDN